MNISIKKFTYNNITVEYMEGGTGKTMLFLPGGIRSGVYEENIELLSKIFHLVVPELPGFGNATVPNETWGLEEYGDFFIRFIKEVQLRDIILVGHSLGGGVALAIARSCPEVKQVLLFGSAGVSPPFSKKIFLTNLVFKKTYYDLWHTKSLMIKTILMNNAVSTIFENCRNVFHLISIAKKCIYTNLKGLENVHAPVTLIWGDKDELFPLSCAEILKKSLPNATLEIIDGNHDWCVLNPQKSTLLLKQFIR